MKSVNNLALFILVLTISGCASKPPKIDWSQKSSDEIFTATKIIDSRYNSSTDLFSPSIYLTIDQPHFDTAVVVLNATIDKKSLDKKPIYFLLINESYRDKTWRFYRSISFLGGDVRMPISQKRDVDCSPNCGYVESLAFRLSDNDLALGKAHGFNFQIRADRGKEQETFIPSEFVRGFENRVIASASQ